MSSKPSVLDEYEQLKYVNQLNGERGLGTDRSLVQVRA